MECAVRSKCLSKLSDLITGDPGGTGLPVLGADTAVGPACCQLKPAFSGLHQTARWESGAGSWPGE